MTGDKDSRHGNNMPEEEANETMGEEGPSKGDHEPGEVIPEEEVSRTGEEVEKENEELRNRVLYLHAELDNLRKRMAKEKTQLIAYSNERLIKELIPLLDNLELAIAHGKEGSGSDQLLSGVELIYSESLKILRKFGVEQLDAEGKAFDPTVHEAVSQTRDPEREVGMVSQVLRKGYILNGRLLRPVQVVVVADEESGKSLH